MIPKGFYNNGLFVSEFEDYITDESDLFYEVAYSLFKKTGINENILEIRPNPVNLDFDSFDVITQENNYTIVLSFDEQSFFVNSQSNFIKNNSHPMLPEYVDSGTYKLGENLNYLVYKSYKGIPLEDVGISYIDTNRYSLLNCLKILKSFKSNISFNDYADFVFKHFDISTSIPQISESQIFSVHNKDKINSISEKIKESFYSSLNFDLLKGNDFCNGNLNVDNISTDGFLFKFHDFHCGFMGKGFLEICFMSLNFGFDKYTFNSYMKDYCEINDIDFDESKAIFRECLDAASHVFLYKKFAEFLVEQCVYENKREERILSILRCFDNAEWCFKRLPVYESLKKDFEEIYQSPAKIY